MGEYLGNTKIGTCEDLFYTRLEDLQRCGDPNAREYLNPANGFRYRFPFPEEDGTKMGDYSPHNKGLLIFLSSALAPTLAAGLKDWEHYDIWHACNYNGAVNVNVKHLCPYHADYRREMGSSVDALAVVLTEVKQVGGEVWVIVDCPYCEAKARLPKEEAAELAACAQGMSMGETDGNYQYWQEVSRRILAGYH